MLEASNTQLLRDALAESDDVCAVQRQQLAAVMQQLQEQRATQMVLEASNAQLREALEETERHTERQRADQAALEAANVRLQGVLAESCVLAESYKRRLNGVRVSKRG